MAKAPATAPAKTGAASAAPANEEEYTAAVRAFLKKNGPTKLAALGSGVRRPANSPKLKNLLQKNKDMFAYDMESDSVSLVG